MSGLFAEHYPQHPGFKKRDTARKAAVAAKVYSGTIRERVLAALKDQPGTADEIAERISASPFGTRPRLSELVAMGEIEDSGIRRQNASGQTAIVWRAVSCVRAGDEAGSPSERSNQAAGSTR